MDHQSLVTVVPWTIIAQICNLFLQIYLFKRFLFKPVQAIMQKRQDEVNKIYDTANDAQASANEAKEKYEALLSSAKVEAAELVRSATATAQKRGDAIVREAKDEAASIREKANSDIAREKKKALNDIKNDISGIAMSIAEKVVEKEINEKDQEAIIASFIDNIGE